MNHSEYAAELFLKGRSCSQAVAVAFCDVTGLTPEFSAKMASSFGGGMGRMREVCGAVSGMLMVLGLLYGYDDNGEKDRAKKAHYALVQELAGKFREKNGSIICREILKNPPSDPAPTPRTAEFYKNRPCAARRRFWTRTSPPIRWRTGRERSDLQPADLPGDSLRPALLGPGGLRMDCHLERPENSGLYHGSGSFGSVFYLDASGYPRQSGHGLLGSGTVLPPVGI